MRKAAAVTPGTKGIIVIAVAAIYGALIMSPLLLNTIPGDLLIPISQMRKQGTDQGTASRLYSLKVAFSGFKPGSSRPKLVIFSLDQLRLRLQILWCNRKGRGEMMQRGSGL